MNNPSTYQISESVHRESIRDILTGVVTLDEAKVVVENLPASQLFDRITVDLVMAQLEYNKRRKE